MDQAKIEERKGRWTRFMDMQSPASHMVMVRLAEDALDTVKPHPDKKQERIEWAWRLYQRQIERMEWLDDDAIPRLWTFTGTEIFAEAFGCDVHRTEDKMPFALPRVFNASDVANVKVPELSSSSLALLFEVADELHRRGGPNALMQTVDIQSPMDISALIWEKSSFFMGMIEAPEAVHELASKVCALLTAFLDEWFSRYGKAHIAHWPDYYMAQGMTLSEDEIGSVSTDAFDEFFLPELEFLSKRYGGMGMHCCANARHQWNGLLRIPGLKLLNLHQKPEILDEAFRFFGPHLAMMNHYLKEDNRPYNLLGKVPEGCRAVFEFAVESKEEAIAAAAKARAAI